MTHDTSWHVADDALRSWVDGAADPLVSASVEQHVQRCAPCQRAVATLVPDDLRPGFDAVLAAVEVPRPAVLERLLRQLGLNGSDARVVASAPSMRVPWVLGMTGVLAFVTLAAVLGDVGGPGLFLLVAPLVPVAGVATAYGPSADASYETVLVTPYAMWRLVLLRAVVVLGTSVPLVVGAGLLLPGSAVVAVAWLLPAAGFIALVLVASSWFDPAYAATGVAVAWSFAVTLAVRTGDAMAVVGPVAVAVYLVVLTGSALLLVQRLVSSTPSWRLR